MTRMQQVIGNTIAEWDDLAPLVWTMTEETGPRDRRETTSENFDLAGLTDGYEMAFLMAFKDLFIERRKRVTLRTLKNEYKGIKVLLAKMQAAQWAKHKVAVIDYAFLTDLRDFDGDISHQYLRWLTGIFTAHRDSPVFAHGLVGSDFPKKTEKKGKLGKRIEIVLTKALSRSVCVHILGAVERAWEKDEIDIGLFAFAQMAFLAFVRPDTYIRLTLGDLFTVNDEATGEKNYYLLLTFPKARTHVAPNRVPFKLNRRIGELLSLQRIHVEETYGHLVDKEYLHRLALFPSRNLNSDGRWQVKVAIENFGRLNDSHIRFQYLDPIRKLADTLFDFNALRHTVGTQLAQAGLSAEEIQAVLKHASDETCRAYVDIHFHCMIDQLSEAMEPAFIKHFPVIERFRSTSDPIDPTKAITSRSEDGRRKELTGECSALIACQFAPICCYACHRFIPCYDVDHSINLDKVEAEIRRYESAGKPFQKMLEMSKEARLYIMLVIAASERYRETLSVEVER